MPQHIETNNLRNNNVNQIPLYGQFMIPDFGDKSQVVHIQNLR